MAHKPIITLIAAFLVLTTVSGCSSRHDAARLRWQRTMDQARVQAAWQGLEEGRLLYAERVLTECDQCSDAHGPLAGQVEQLRARIQIEHNRYAKADSETAHPEEMTY